MSDVISSSSFVCVWIPADEAPAEPAPPLSISSSARQRLGPWRSSPHHCCHNNGGCLQIICIPAAPCDFSLILTVDSDPLLSVSQVCFSSFSLIPGSHSLLHSHDPIVEINNFASADFHVMWALEQPNYFISWWMDRPTFPGLKFNCQPLNFIYNHWLCCFINSSAK